MDSGCHVRHRRTADLPAAVPFEGREAPAGLHPAAIDLPCPDPAALLHAPAGHGGQVRFR